jgi:4-oxalocrotonate tautomerase
MPAVQVQVWEGWGEKNAATVIRGVTKVFTDLGIPAQAVTVIIQEVPKTHWGMQGEPASVVMPDTKPPE